ncbi:smad nuclear-interacting protein 1-like isoform X2 [Eriocheir sinensis]|uniref:smad nuclear-interacting protein 1-like isoform X2 n=1 Tax=Eriocheir sinensis TaxID=95602 RepID=UPI0021C88439|nr:smad nuclear-interacting protein 1-like isoform X2 [Eriocheir sinensis]
MGKSKREYREEEVYASGPSVSGTDDSSGSSNSPSGSSSSSSSSNDDSNSERERRQRRHIKKRSKRKREKRSKRDNSSEEEEEEEDEYGDPDDRRKRSRHTVEEYTEERRHHGTTGGSRRKRRHHHHHHRKHKHKHRHRRRHHSEERSKGGASLERPSEGRKGREMEERRGRERLEPERERRASRETERRERKEEKRSRDKSRSEARPVTSKWDEEEDTPYDPGRRIKVEPGLEGDGSEGGWEGEYENGGSRKRKHHHQQQQHQRRRHQQQENSHRPPHRAKVEVKEEPGSRSRPDTTNSSTASENGRTGWGLSGGGGGGGGDGGGGGGGDGSGGGGGGHSEDPAEGEERQKPNLGVTGKLAEDANTYNGVVIKYSQPPEARKPKRRWRWYIFKGDEELPFLPLHRQSAYLIGRDRKVADIPTDHPSCSKQHAVLQYRLVTYKRGDGTKGRTVKPYILDLESANGTYVNNRRIDAKRFVELLEKDVVKFGYSSREYILLHEGSKGDDEDIPDTGTDLSPVSMLRS